MSSFISKLAVVDETAYIAEGVSVWHFSQIRENSKIGHSSIIGKSVYIGSGVNIGARCKIQNNAQIFEPCTIEDDVFIGPGVVLTNDKTPRAVNPDGSLKNESDWISVGVTVKKGASVGANVTCVAPTIIGSWSMIGAGSVVTRDVPAHALMVGVPAKQVGWVGKSGNKLIKKSETLYLCSTSGAKYSFSDGLMTSHDE